MSGGNQREGQMTGQLRHTRRARLARMIGRLGLALVVGASAVAAASPALAAEEDRDQLFHLLDGTVFAKAHAPVPNIVTFGVGHPSNYRNLVRNASPVYQAGVHPDASTGFQLSVGPNGVAPLPVKDVVVDGPPGFVGSTTAVPVCPMRLFMQEQMGTCSSLSQVGVAQALTQQRDVTVGSSSPIYKLPPPPDAPAMFGYRTTLGQVIKIVPRLRSDGDYGLRIRASDLPSNFGLLESVSTLWGVPYDPVHDAQRARPLPTGVDRKAFLTNPTYCDSGPLQRTVSLRPWVWLDHWASTSVLGEQEPHGCELLEFGTLRAPVSLTLQPDGQRAGGPSGLGVQLKLPFNHDPYGLARPALRHTTVELPEGLTINPSAAGGLRACSEAEIGLNSLDLPSCPDASKLASVDVVSPLLEKPLDGTVFLAEQGRNSLGATMAIYLHVAGQGVQAKVAGRVDRDPVTGQITSTFKDSPQLPFTDMTIRFKPGPRASLVMPRLCGRYETESTLTPWSHPHTGPPVQRTDGFDVGGEKGCVSRLSDRSFEPRMEAGSTNPVGGANTEFVVRFTRGDEEQEFDRITARTPKGLAASIKDVPYCSEAGIAQAISRDQDGDGAVEQADPSCSDASKVGRTIVGAGVGSRPFYVPGNAYLAGPYKGAPLSLVFIVPAVAGPFDLGVQVVRAAVNVDRRSAQITTVSDEIPKILDGIPVRLKDIRVIMDRPSFMLNPTDCTEQRIAATVVGTTGATSEVSDRFQVGDCQALPFKPNLSLELTGRNQRTTGKHPGVNAVVRQTGVGEAGIRKAKVTLPKSLALDVNNAQALCEFEDGTKDDLENHCPAGSIVGKAQAVSPLLKQPLKGNVYFVKNIRRDPKTGNAIRTLPMIIVALRGEVAINLRGESDTTRAGRLVNTFDQTPDAPISRFDLNMNGGANGILAVTRTRTANINLCTRPKSHVADADMDGQNGKRYDRAIRMKTPCTKRQIKKAKRAAAKKRNS